MTKAKDPSLSAASLASLKQTAKRSLFITSQSIVPKTSLCKRMLGSQHIPKNQKIILKMEKTAKAQFAVIDVGTIPIGTTTTWLI